MSGAETPPVNTPASNRLDEIIVRLGRIEAQVKQTNGRVTHLEERVDIHDGNGHLTVSQRNELLTISQRVTQIAEFVELVCRWAVRFSRFVKVAVPTVTSLVTLYAYLQGWFS